MMDTPNIRFKGYTDLWEQRKLGNIILEYSEKNPVDEELPVLTSSRQGIQKQEEHFGSEQKHDTTDYNVIPRGYCTYRNRSDDKTFTFNVNDCVEKGIVSKFYPVFSIVDGNAKFITEYLNTNVEIRNRLAVLAVGTSQVVLSLSNLKNISILVPNKKEQDKIGEAIIEIDNLITLHQRKCDEMTKLKKFMLQKMFPKNSEQFPEIRFSGFTEPWERRRFGDIFGEYSEKNHGELPALMIIQGGGTIRRDASDRSLSYDKENLSNYKMVNKGDFIVHLRSFEGGLEMATDTGIISPAYHTFHGENTDSRFYYSYFRSKKFIDTDLKPHVYGIRDGRSIDINGMKTIKIPYTSSDEQRVIGEYIERLDNFITLHQRKRDELKDFKKFMLQNMFPKKG